MKEAVGEHDLESIHRYMEYSMRPNSHLVRDIYFLSLSGKRVRLGLDGDPYQRMTPEGGAVFEERPKGLSWTVFDPEVSGSGREIVRWFKTKTYACPTPKWDGIALIGKSMEYGNPDGYGLVLNADGSLRWIVQPPIILSEPLSVSMRGELGSEMRECVLRDHDKTHIYWNVVFPDPAFNWSEMRQYDPDTNRFTDKVVRTSRD